MLLPSRFCSFRPLLIFEQQVRSRIIIDTYAWNRFNPNKQVNLASLASPFRKARSDQSEDEDENYDDEGYEPDEVIATGGKSDPTPLTSDQLLLCSASLKGYSLKNKKWLTFYIGSVLDIEYNESAFESLVLPEEHKELILALAESQVQNRDSFDDVIQGKGKGMIMLLSGPPGVGKTLTAESGELYFRQRAVICENTGLTISSSRRDNARTSLHDERQ